MRSHRTRGPSDLALTGKSTPTGVYTEGGSQTHHQRPAPGWEKPGVGGGASARRGDRATGARGARLVLREGRERGQDLSHFHQTAGPAPEFHGKDRNSKELREHSAGQQT